MELGNPYSIFFDYYSDNLRDIKITAAYLYDEDETTNYTIMFTTFNVRGTTIVEKKPKGLFNVGGRGRDQESNITLPYKPAYYLKMDLLVERLDGEQILKEVTLRFELNYTVKRINRFYFVMMSA